jgi:hypothetical protein
MGPSPTCIRSYALALNKTDLIQATLERGDEMLEAGSIWQYKNPMTGIAGCCAYRR